MIIYLIIIGFVSILGQVIILRELNVAFYGVELIYILSMGGWLFWTGFGAFTGRRTYVPSVSFLRYAFLIFSILLPLETAFIRYISLLFSGIPGAYLPFTAQLSCITITLLPVGILNGLIFQWAAKLYIGNDKTLAGAYAIESAGGLVGGLVSTLLFRLGMQNFAIALLCSVITSGYLFFSYNPAKDRTRITAGFISGVLICLLCFSHDIDFHMTQWHHPYLTASKDSPYSRITISGMGDMFSVFENNALGFETQTTGPEEFVHLAALQSAFPRHVLVSGGGVSGVVDEILKHRPVKVDYVEMNPVLLDMAEKYLPEKFTLFLNSKKVRVYHDDPRKFLKNASNYDLILAGMPEPDSGQSNRFYTREYFMQCAERLNPDGILAFGLRSSENIWTRSLTLRNASIFLSLKSVFHDVVVLPGTTNIIIASQKHLTRNPDILIEIFKKRSINTRLITPDYIRYLYTNDRFEETARILASEKTDLNTDIHPVCYKYSCMIWLSKFIPGLINKDIFSHGLWKYLILFIFTLVCIAAARLGAEYRRIFTAALAGFTGMILETMLILYYQAKSGALFQDIGILLMVFMAGLTAGSAVLDKLAEKKGDEFDSFGKLLGRCLLTCFGIFCLIFSGILYTGYMSGISDISLLLFLTGFLVSSIFACVSLCGIKEQKHIVSPLYGADLLGGCFASICASLFFIPFLGMGQSVIFMGVLLFIAVIF